MDYRELTSRNDLLRAAELRVRRNGNREVGRFYWILSTFISPNYSSSLSSVDESESESTVTRTHGHVTTVTIMRISGSAGCPTAVEGTPAWSRVLGAERSSGLSWITDGPFPRDDADDAGTTEVPPSGRTEGAAAIQR